MAWLSTQATPLARLRWPGNAPTAVALANRAFGGWKQPPAAVAQPPAAAALPPAAAKPSNGLISAKNAKNRKPKRGCPQKNFQKKSFLVFRVHRCHKWPYLDIVFFGTVTAVTISLLAVTISIWSCKTPPGYTKKAYKHFLLTYPCRTRPRIRSKSYFHAEITVYSHF